ncbi:MAG: Nif3-like dinuclear metal center hexameric protein [Deltaproteobacteria bacterium RIFOXYA12_FULL_61_11]|nr:MAG: Nif3-like dinuclear metal center hexameric protein [Deltaproteobacteria bacterium RIFOXYA12_FULL_61_11]
MQLQTLTSYLDTLLRIDEYADSSQNGLQVEGRGEVNHVAFAVDANLQVFQRATETDVDLLVVHHGLFWNQPVLLTRLLRRRVGHLLGHGISLYAAHLPLDLHPELGNNRQLLNLLDLNDGREFGQYKGTALGFSAEYPTPIPLENLLAVVRAKLTPHFALIGFGPRLIRTVAAVSGAIPTDMLQEAWLQKVDLLLTGETGHHLSQDAEDLGLNLLCLGHYLSETFGIKALMRHLAAQFPLRVSFIDHPTGY